MTETRVMTEDLRVAIERSGYYPGLVTDAVTFALGSEPVTAFFVHTTRYSTRAWKSAGT